MPENYQTLWDEPNEEKDRLKILGSSIFHLIKRVNSDADLLLQSKKELVLSNREIKNLQSAAFKSANELSNAKREIKRLQSVNGQFATKLDRLNTKYEATTVKNQERIEQLKISITKTREKLAKVELHNKQLKESTSWKITKPLRIFVNFVRRRLRKEI